MYDYSQHIPFITNLASCTVLLHNDEDMQQVQDRDEGIQSDNKEQNINKQHPPYRGYIYRQQGMIGDIYSPHGELPWNVPDMKP